ncbi:hypothetical protein ABT168_28705 [Streptomyces sp. NPDC001793]|uniref:hypothetical protein n=1 Tax=Streptomyces sp. NPDC001793 TaxID=3154657 RepID=UPI003317D1B5
MRTPASRPPDTEEIGLALRSGFEPSTAEAEFLSDRLACDRYQTMSHLLAQQRFVLHTAIQFLR